MNPRLLIQDESRKYMGDCVFQNTKKFIELREKFGDCIRLVSLRKKQFEDENKRQQIKFFKDTGLEKTKKFSKNYRFHVLIHNTRKDQYIDVSNGRLMIIPREEYQADMRTFGGYQYSTSDVWDIYMKNKDNDSFNRSVSKHDFIIAIVYKWWGDWGF